MKITKHKDGAFSIETSKTNAEIKAMSNEDLILEGQRLFNTGGDLLTLMMIEGELNQRGLQMPCNLDKDMLDEFEKELTVIGKIFQINLGEEDPADIAKKVRKKFEEK